MSQDNFGIDLLFESQKNNIKTSTDVLIILTHWKIVKNGFRCAGIGDNKVFDKNDKLSELLPEDWNIDAKVYTLRYALNETIYILYGVRSSDDDLLILNFFNTKTFALSSLVLRIDKLVKSKSGETLEDFVNDTTETTKKLQNSLIDDFLKEEKPETPTTSSNIQPPLRHPVNPQLIYDHGIGILPRNPLRDVGRGDLDPFGRGGGMLYNPIEDRNFIIRPRVPPGARFDPIYPNNRDVPNPDHMRPPDGYDDMFM